MSSSEKCLKKEPASLKTVHQDSPQVDRLSKDLDTIDRNILRTLSLYDSLALLELWYELGEDDAIKNERITREEALSRLESLMDQGLVERVRKGEGAIRWALRKREIEALLG
jgi:hypothetical protein